MISDLSLSLRALLSQSGVPPELAAAQIVFDRPTEQFTPTQTAVDLFLYDIREDRDFAAAGSGRPLACTYLITAWPVGGAEPALQEQQLLSDVLQVLAAHPTIPPQFLRGSLTGHDPPPQLLVMHPDAVKSTAEFWTALGSKLRPSLSVTATIRVSPLAGDRS